MFKEFLVEFISRYNTVPYDTEFHAVLQLLRMDLGRWIYKNFCEYFVLKWSCLAAAYYTVFLGAYRL